MGAGPNKLSEYLKMPIKPRTPFLKIVCQSCGWKSIIRQQSDALICPSICPSCGSESLERSFAGHMESFLTSPASYVGTLLKGS
jgi:ribosomal protein S27E